MSQVGHTYIGKCHISVVSLRIIVGVGMRMQALWLSSCPQQRHGGVKEEGSVRVIARCLMQQEGRVGSGGRSQD